MSQDLTVVFTGGGTPGHITPNIAIIRALQKKAVQCVYIGSTSGLEEELIKPLNIPYYAVRTGKLRRYFSLKTLLEPFQIMLGILAAFQILGKIKPNLVFSKGGFVAFPVVVAAFFRRTPVITHESDLTPGLANKLSFPFSQKICITFASGKKYFKNKEKLVITGTPIREKLFEGNPEKAKALCHFIEDKPTLLVTGGGQGSAFINQVVREDIKRITSLFNVIHLCGKNKRDENLTNIKGYAQFEYLDDELSDCYALADCVVARAGANSVYEILALKKPHIFIPLSLQASRGDQIQNANHFKSLGVSEVLQEEELTSNNLYQKLNDLLKSKTKKEKAIAALNICSGTDKVVAQIMKNARYS